MKKAMLFEAAVVVFAGAAILSSSNSASADTLNVSRIVATVTINSDMGTVDLTNISVKNTSGNVADNETISEFILPTISAGTGNPGDAVTGVALFDDVSGNLAGNCYLGEVLAKDASCNLELAIAVTGVAPVGRSGPASKTDLINHLDGTTVGVNSNSLTNSANFDADVTFAPEPSGIILLGSGLLGLAGAFRRKLSRG
jgi:hypothetical protein